MKKRSINIYFLICISLIAFLSCNERNNQSVMDANSKDSIIESDGPSNNISQFTHPGISISSSILSQVSSENDSYRLDGYNEVLKTINNHIPFPSFTGPITIYTRIPPLDTTPTEHQIRNDAILAYAHALKWARTGNSNDASKAKQILNGWAEHFAGMEACSQSHDPEETGCCYEDGDPATCPSKPKSLNQRLLASWVAPNFAAAAEIIRHHSRCATGCKAGWSETDAEAFEDFLLELNSTYIDHLVSRVISNPSGGWANNNWGASAAYAQMAIGVFTENSTIYEKGKYAIIKNNGLIENIIDYPSGEVNELASRDCGHPNVPYCTYIRCRYSPTPGKL